MFEKHVPICRAISLVPHKVRRGAAMSRRLCSLADASRGWQGSVNSFPTLREICFAYHIDFRSKSIEQLYRQYCVLGHEMVICQ